MSQKNRIRLYTDQPLGLETEISCSPEQMHYLVNVMRLNIGSMVYLFNGQDGEFCATVSAIEKKQCRLKIASKFAEFSKCPDITLLFAPLKKDNTAYLIQKAVELGVSTLQPVITEYTNAPLPRAERVKAQIIEAAEQSRRQDIPLFLEPVSLENLLTTWDSQRRLIYFDETGKGVAFQDAAGRLAAPAALFIGPEGGFSEKELEILQKQSYTTGITLGKRILRAETAAAAALACWQAFCGDWRS